MLATARSRTRSAHGDLDYVGRRAPRRHADHPELVRRRRVRRGGIRRRSRVSNSAWARIATPATPNRSSPGVHLFTFVETRIASRRWRTHRAIRSPPGRSSGCASCCLAFPETSEKLAWGHPTFRVRDKIFATIGVDGDGHEGHDDARSHLPANRTRSSPRAHRSSSRSTSACAAGSASSSTRRPIGSSSPSWSKTPTARSRRSVSSRCLD